MTDQEREAVGIHYKTHGQEAAIQLGHELVTASTKAQRVAEWKAFSAEHPEGALFCFRGGLRSEITQRWLCEVGVNYPRIEGGYKAMRRWLSDHTDAYIATIPLLLLGGQTGAAKTRVLNEGNAGLPIPGSIDLEGLANHRGSAFGKRVTAQPSQISFELAFGIEVLKRSHEGHSTLVLEDEGRLIGRCALPLCLQTARKEADWIQLDAGLDERVQHSYENYILSNLKELRKPVATEALGTSRTGCLSLYSAFRSASGAAVIKRSKTHSMRRLRAHQQGNPELHKLWIKELLTEYYDPMYQYQMTKRIRPPLFKGEAKAVIEYLLERTNPAHRTQ